MRNTKEIKEISAQSTAEAKKNIIKMVNQIENLDYLNFILNMLIAFKKKWGI